MNEIVYYRTSKPTKFIITRFHYKKDIEKKKVKK